MRIRLGMEKADAVRCRIVHLSVVLLSINPHHPDERFTPWRKKSLPLSRTYANHSPIPRSPSMSLPLTHKNITGGMHIPIPLGCSADRLLPSPCTPLSSQGQRHCWRPVAACPHSSMLLEFNLTPKRCMVPVQFCTA